MDKKRTPPEMREMRIPVELYNLFVVLYKDYFKRNIGHDKKYIGDGEVIAMMMVCAMHYQDLIKFIGEKENDSTGTANTDNQ